MNAVQNFFVCNGELLPVSDFSEEKVMGQIVVYEVIKIIRSLPVFFDEHMQRMRNSMRSASLRADGKVVESLVRASVVQLLQANPVQRNNIRVTLVFNQQASLQHTVVQFIASSYPSADDYRNGVPVATLQAERHNPTAKIEDRPLRERANQLIRQNALYEVLYVDQNGEITEGSRSNVFFVKGQNIITAPHQRVLGGITREKVLECCKQHGFALELRCLPQTELPAIDAMFLTGTSPCVLPINNCNSASYIVDSPIVDVLAKAYAKMEEDSLKRKLV